VLLAHFHPERPLTHKEVIAIDVPKEMLDVKRKHARLALRRTP